MNAPDERNERIRAGRAKGGRSRSPAKLAAVRENGRKGGRPRKHVLTPNDEPKWSFVYRSEDTKGGTP